MSFIDVAIPGVAGLVIFLWPKAMFLGSCIVPTEKKIHSLRYLGVFLLLVAALNLISKFVGK